MTKIEELKTKDLSEELLPFLSEDVKEVVSKRVSSLLEPNVYGVRYVEVLFNNRDDNREKAFKELARKLEKVFKKYGIVGSLSVCVGLDLVGPGGIIAPLRPDWDYKKNPIGPGTLGWGKTEGEIEELRDRILLISYPAIPWDNLFTPEGEIPKNIGKDRMATEDCLKRLLEWVPESVPLEKISMVNYHREVFGKVFTLGDEKCPFFSEAYLYNLLGKEDARTLLALIRRVCESVGFKWEIRIEK